jgi:hypothetical protein
MGGLSKKAYQIEAARKTADAPVLVLDAGNLLFKRATPLQSQSQETITAAGIRTAYAMMGYDAVAVGPLDLAAGIDFLKKAEGQPLTWLSADILDATERPVFPPSMVKTAGPMQIGIIGLTNRDALLPAGFHIGDWRTILPAQLAVLAKKCNAIILLSNLSANENEEIAQRYPGISLIISAAPQMSVTSPVHMNNTIITGTAPQGKILGILDISWGNTGRWESDLGKRMHSLTISLETVNTQIATEVPQENQAESSRLLQLKDIKQDLLRQIDSIKGKYEAENPAGSIPASFTEKSVALTSALPESSNVEQVVSDIKQKIAIANDPARRTSAAGSPPPQEQEASAYVGFVQCRACHQVQADFWASTRHARAFVSLQRVHQEKNLECLPCHVTSGTGLPPKDAAQGQKLLALPAAMQAVGCEVCHGPGRAHVEDQTGHKPVKTITQGICIACHTQERDPGFNFEAKERLIRCPPSSAAP